MGTMIYLCWFDDTPRRPLADKVAAARAAFMERYGVPATLALVADAAEPVAVAGCEVRPAHAGEIKVVANMVFVGRA